ncbi:DNA topoisomerase IV subunit B [Pelagibius marinus]|uniref:DNA topoisomerase IV subunit B n=1 Tax=Pelagibius marinus TaxID=2762760 RepID=UPI0018723EB5|nr:DNA topoisomerase IV subunit B [Pelagibius marinus]
MADLFQTASKKSPGNRSGGKQSGYSAKDIEVLEGLEPVRRRPGMYIGGNDERAMHHLVAEVLDNAMDEAVAGHATRIEMELKPGNVVVISDNGRGIPVDPHPKYKPKSALEVILTTLHSGAKFSQKAYATSGGLHGVGVSVVNALSDDMTVEVARDQKLYVQSYSKGKAKTKLSKGKPVKNRRGTTIQFHPDPSIFEKDAAFQPSRLYRMARSKAYLFRGVEIRWSCDKSLIATGDDTPDKDNIHFPNGLEDFLAATLDKRKTLTPDPFVGEGKFPSDPGRVEWAISWPMDENGFLNSYCNTVPTPEGGSHEAGLRSGLLKSIKAYAELSGNKKAGNVNADDVCGGACIMLSLFIGDPQFQGQTKEKLATASATKLVETSIKDHFDHWLSGHPERARMLLERIVERSEERRRRREEKEQSRKTATRKLRLPGKLSDCSRNRSEGTEIFLVEGDSAGGSAKQARSRETQAVLPLRGKILNVASASADKLKGNQEISDITQALGCGSRGNFDVDKLRYERIIIMTDADVDGAHIASLLITFFYKEMPGLIENGRLYLAQPPLYRLTQGSESVYAMDDKEKEELFKSHFKGRGKIEVSRFKGLGEMPARQLKETTMDPGKRTLLRVTIVGEKDENPAAEEKKAADLIERLMGRKAETRFAFIQENARFVEELDF